MSPYLRFAALAIVVPLAVGCSSEPTATPELAAQWWQWTKSAPAPVNPVRDLSGEHCAVGQTGSVWFLAGGYGSSKIRRRCTVPADQALFFPVIKSLGYDPIWFGVMVALVMQTSFLTPPVGYTLAYLRSVAPPSVSTQAIWVGAVPFILLQLLAVLTVYFLPGLATWLPAQLF